MESKDDNPQAPAAPVGLDVAARLALPVLVEAFSHLVEIHGYLYSGGDAVVALSHKTPLALDKGYGEGALLNLCAGGIISHTDPIHFSVRASNKYGFEEYFLANGASILDISWDRRDTAVYDRSQAVEVLRNALDSLFQKGVASNPKFGEFFAPHNPYAFHNKNWIDDKVEAHGHMQRLANWWGTMLVFDNYLGPHIKTDTFFKITPIAECCDTTSES